MAVAKKVAAERRMAYKVADMKLAEWGRKELNIAEKEMPGLMATRKKYAKTSPITWERRRPMTPTSDCCSKNWPRRASLITR